MAKNFVFKDADYISLPVPNGTRGGSPLRVGLLNVVTVTDEGGATQTISLGNGASITQRSGGIGNKPGFASCALKGSAKLTVTGVTTVGGPVYIKTADNTLNTAGGAGTVLFGAALEVKTAPAGLCHVKIINGGSTASA